MKIGKRTSSSITVSTGFPQDYVLSPLLFTLLTHDCTARFSSNHIIKFVDDPTVVSLIINNNDTLYRKEVEQLTRWCGKNNLSLNVEETKEMIPDFRRSSSEHPPVTINGIAV